MADNVAITPGTGSTIAADDLAGVLHQRVKIEVGADGVANDVAPASADAAANTGTIPIHDLIYNGATYDRERSANAANNTTGTGLRGAGVLIYNGTNWNRLGAGSLAADGASGDNSVRVAPVVYNGATFDRLRGDIANGVDVDVTRVTGTVTVDSELPAPATLSDAAANPTTPSVGSYTLAFNGATWDRIRGDTTNGLDVDVTRVTGTVTVDSELPAAGVLADSAATPTTPVIGGFGHRYNGATWDFDRANLEGTALSSLSRTTNTASSALVNYNARGVIVIFSITAAPSSGNLQLQIRGRTGALTWNVLQSATIINTGTFVYEIYPGVGTVASDGVTARVSGLLPRSWDVNVVHSTANPATYSVSYALAL